MEPESHIWVDIISSAVVPVVIISACGLLCLAFYNRLAMVVTRLRSLQRERLAEYKELFKLENDKDAILRLESEHFLHFLEDQTADVFKRARLLRNCIFCLIGCTFALVFTSVFIGLSVIFPVLDLVVLIFFVMGLGLLMVGLTFAAMEIWVALKPIESESGFVQRLIKSQLKK